MLEIKSDHKLILSSCPFEVTEDLQNFAAVTTKSFSLNPIQGPCLFQSIGEGAYINRWGLDNPGIKHVLGVTVPEIKRHQDNVIASLFLESPEDFSIMAQQLTEGLFCGIELNISCPNKSSIDNFIETTKNARTLFDGNLGLKIGFNLPFQVLVGLGLDFISYSNTIPHYVEGFGNGGLSGAPLRKEVINRLTELRESLPDVTLIVGGGVASASDYHEYLGLGADFVGIASHYLQKRDALFEILSEI